MPATHLALLRGVNVGGKNRLPMKDLAEMFVEAGCKDVRTFIQSGNVIFNASSAVAARVAGGVATRIAEKFGHNTPVVLRTTAQLRNVIENNPFLHAGEPEGTLFVMFLKDLPVPDAVAALNPDRSPPDKFIVRGADVYLHLPAGSADSKLTNAYFDSKLSTVGTSRNWRTLTKLLELMQG